jgi:hypothetical protein
MCSQWTIVATQCLTMCGLLTSVCLCGASWFLDYVGNRFEENRFPDLSETLSG